ncbi:XRE family transcriptional regulator, partial [Salmonella enterica subsp. enterica]|nr:XRE family transcriptional regulator [Salmonella enterica subsp. enterica]ECF3547654.1 XRE family transcriptional regulator [Salmonella enterica subsp. enterica]ECJ5186030.1 XRE family transcriptional regulator [Salmonella enterica subsp. enterica]MKA16113.1 XRE family transcriptional regulator [Salmonella enterica subsp. enterica]
LYPERFFPDGNANQNTTGNA